MKVLLTQDLDKIGKAGQVKNVPDGYARNYLIPKGLAILASPNALKQAETIRKTEEKRQAQLFAQAQALAAQLGETTLSFRAKAGETGKLYGSITPTDIVEAIMDKKGIEIDKRKIELREPIRTVGAHKVPIKLAANLVAEVSLVVEAEAEEAEETKPAAAAVAEPAATPVEPEAASEAVPA
jgi:large subunit ribosomal protein L9